jgi:hypothetical protein
MGTAVKSPLFITLYRAASVASSSAAQMPIDRRNAPKAAIETFLPAATA